MKERGLDGIGKSKAVLDEVTGKKIPKRASTAALASVNSDDSTVRVWSSIGGITKNSNSIWIVCT